MGMAIGAVYPPLEKGGNDMEDISLNIKCHIKKSCEDAKSAYGILGECEQDHKELSDSMAMWYALLLSAMAFGGERHDV